MQNVKLINALTVAEANAIRGLTTNPLRQQSHWYCLTGAGIDTALADEMVILI